MRKEITMSMSNSIDETPVAQLVQTANEFDSDIYLEQGRMRVNAKSFMGLMNLIITRGSKIVIEAKGADEEKAVEAMEAFLTR